jgi:hypothetical protein
MTSESSVQRNPSQIYKYHVENLRELNVALRTIYGLAKEEIARQDPENSQRSLLRMYTLLIGAWAECRLQKLLHEEFGFTPAERAQIQSKNNQLDCWKETVDLAFRKHYAIEVIPLDEQSLGSQNHASYMALKNILENELRLVIEIRNKLAHGQWINPLNSQGTRLNLDKQRLLDAENLMSLQFKYSLIGHLADIIHDLVVSPETFERDFNNHYSKLRQAQINLQKRDYSKFRDRLLENRANTRRISNQQTVSNSDNQLKMCFRSLLKALSKLLQFT